MNKERKTYMFINEYDIRLERKMTRPTYQSFIERMTARERFEDPVLDYDYQEVLVVSIPEVKLDQIFDIIYEYQSLLQDPETRELIQQAKFIQELKGNE